MPTMPLPPTSSPAKPSAAGPSAANSSAAGPSAVGPSPATSSKTGPSLPLAAPARGETILDAPEHVLSTLEADGSRLWLFPKLSPGRWWKRRRWVAYGLIAFFVLLPHLRISGKPIVLLDVLAREFTFFGHTFLPTDTLLLTLLMLGIFIAIVAATAVTGRVWCGWGCPQTVYMEFLFRPIDRLFQGTAGKGGKPKRKLSGGMWLARVAVYFVVCSFLAHTFLAYFVGTDNLANWLFGSPLNHPIAFLVMLGTTLAMMFDFMYFREQLCLIACPYGRFQSVMLDRNSLIVGYDRKRGEPRKKGKHVEGDGAGSCVDCKQCVVVCPTGIDIRDGLQMECINCTQCIDACDNVMDKVGQPRGLIRYGSQDSMDGKTNRLLRPRTIIYPALLCIVSVAFLVVLSTKYAFDARLLRQQQGNPYYRAESGQIANRYRLRLTNRTDAARSYSIQPLTPASSKIEMIESDDIRLDVGESRLFAISVSVAPTDLNAAGRSPFELKIVDDLKNERIVDARIIGPQR